MANCIYICKTEILISSYVYNTVEYVMHTDISLIHALF